MKLFLTDYHLEACRNIKKQLSEDRRQSTGCLAAKTTDGFEIIEDGQTLSLTKEQMQEKFTEHFKEAERLINETGYHRRDKEIEELRGGN